MRIWRPTVPRLQRLRRIEKKGKKSGERRVKRGARKVGFKRIKPVDVPGEISRIMRGVHEVQDAAFREMFGLGLTVMPEFKPLSMETVSTVQFGRAKPEQVRRAFEIASAAEERITPAFSLARVILEDLERKVKDAEKKAYNTNRLNRKKRINRFTRLKGISLVAWETYNMQYPLIFDVIRDLHAKLEKTGQKT